MKIQNSPTKSLAVGLVASAALLGAASAAVKPNSESPTRAAIETANEQFMSAVQRADAPSIAGMYTQDAEIFPPLGITVHGRRAIEEYWQGVLDMGIAKVVVATDEVVPLDDFACEVGTYTLHDSSSSPIASGKYMTIWKREGGQWRVHRDMGNLSMAHRDGAR